MHLYFRIPLPEDILNFVVFSEEFAKIMQFCYFCVCRRYPLFFQLLTNNPKKLESIKGVEIVERLPVIAEKHELNKNYLKAKQEFGHLL
jgi:hypothetical protein